jgi:RNA polymerase sigma-70 factor (ECF subfamily)
MSAPSHSTGPATAEGPGSTSTGLLQRVQAKDPDAWTRLVNLYGPLVYHWCRQANLKAEDAVDVVQETFLAVSNHIDSFRRDRPGDSFRGWLWTVTRNKIQDHFRRLQGHAQGQGGTEALQELDAVPDVLREQEPSAPSTGMEPSLYQRVLASTRLPSRNMNA